jgi:hypothetical protein
MSRCGMQVPTTQALHEREKHSGVACLFDPASFFFPFRDSDRCEVMRSFAELVRMLAARFLSSSTVLAGESPLPGRLRFAVQPRLIYQSIRFSWSASVQPRIHTLR